ncbi:MAG: phosphoglucosamine mutase, partial [Proteobacteria bacterium]|nr:phosphoglucosamine mutase [Pseudomonadota bacterium]
MINVPIDSQSDIISQPSVQAAIQTAEQQLQEQGRILLRPSGTEPLIRVMVEGTDKQQVETIAYQLAETVKQAVHF